MPSDVSQLPDDPVFDQALTQLWPDEGGFVNDRADPGGATNLGITLYTLRKAGELDGIDVDLAHDGTVDVADLQALDKATAAQIYRAEWWERYGYHQIDAPRVAMKIFNLAVNIGPRPAAKVLQWALNAFAFSALTVDGELGVATFGAVNAVSDPDELFEKIVVEAQAYYHGLVAINPTLSKYLNGWLARAARG